MTVVLPESVTSAAIVLKSLLDGYAFILAIQAQKYTFTWRRGHDILSVIIAAIYLAVNICAMSAVSGITVCVSLLPSIGAGISLCAQVGLLFKVRWNNRLPPSILMCCFHVCANCWFALNTFRVPAIVIVVFGHLALGILCWWRTDYTESRIVWRKVKETMRHHKNGHREYNPAEANEMPFYDTP